MSYPFQQPVLSLVNAIVDQDYGAALRSLSRSRLTAADLKRVTVEYGCTFTHLPATAVSLWDVTAIEGASGRWTVAVPMWTIEEGRSDLTLELTISQVADGWLIDLDDLHAL